MTKNDLVIHDKIITIGKIDWSRYKMLDVIVNIPYITATTKVAKDAKVEKGTNRIPFNKPGLTLDEIIRYLQDLCERKKTIKILNEELNEYKNIIESIDNYRSTNNQDTENEVNYPGNIRMIGDAKGKVKTYSDTGFKAYGKTNRNWNDLKNLLEHVKGGTIKELFRDCENMKIEPFQESVSNGAPVIYDDVGTGDGGYMPYQVMFNRPVTQPFVYPRDDGLENEMGMFGEHLIENPYNEDEQKRNRASFDPEEQSLLDKRIRASFDPEEQSILDALASKEGGKKTRKKRIIRKKTKKRRPKAKSRRKPKTK